MSAPQPPADTAAGGIVRLVPGDGLFLRAEHLDRIQDYARELVLALGVAGGPGVVHGFGVTLETDARQGQPQQDVLRITPGLAVAPDGRPLRTDRMIAVALPSVPDPDTFFVIEAVAVDRPFGEEPVYGAVCDDSCAGRSTLQPYLSEEVKVRLRPAHVERRRADAFEKLSGQTATNSRAWLASAYFAHEQEGSWLRPPGAGLGARPWSQPTGSPEGTAVPLAVLHHNGGEWKLDVWTARRDRGDPPRRAWQHRLAMRPWEVFLAQVLQFQAQLAELRQGPASAPVVARLTPAELATRLDTVATDLRTSRRTTRAAEALAELAAEADPGRSSLPELGIHELPPAGFLPVYGSEGAAGDRAAVEHLLASHGASPALDVRFRRCRADEVAHEVEGAQHGDRIRFDRSPPDRVDVLVPEPEGGGHHPWVAFVRAGPRGEVLEEVDLVVVLSGDGDEYERRVQEVRDDGPEAVSDEWDPEPWRATLTYPPEGWAVPSQSDDYVHLHEDVARAADRDSVTVVTCVTSEHRRPLGGVRATLLVATFTEDDRGFRSQVEVRPGTRETVVVLIRRSEPA